MTLGGGGTRAEVTGLLPGACKMHAVIHGLQAGCIPLFSPINLQLHTDTEESERIIKKNAGTQIQLGPSQEHLNIQE